MFVLYLLSPGFKVVLVLGDSFSFAFANLNSVWPAVVAYSIDVVHHHRAVVVVVVNHRHVDVGHRAVVGKFSSAPFTTPEADSRVTVAIVNPAVEADVRPPVAVLPYGSALREAPITRRPE